jgi:hypothetical protein
MMNKYTEQNWINRRQRIAERHEREAQSPALGIRIRTPYRDSATRPQSTVPQDVADHNSRVRDNA